MKKSTLRFMVAALGVLSGGYSVAGATEPMAGASPEPQLPAGQPTPPPPPVSPEQQAAADKLGLPVANTNSIGMRLVLVPAGEFIMGSTEAVAEKSGFHMPTTPTPVPLHLDLPTLLGPERPQHRVRITKPFYFGMHEVTVKQFRQFVEASGYRTDTARGKTCKRRVMGGMGGGMGGGGMGGGMGGMGGGMGGGGMGGGGMGGGGMGGMMGMGGMGGMGGVGGVLSTSDDHPVVNVDWKDAVAFCAWLSGREGRLYGLPTECSGSMPAGPALRQAIRAATPPLIYETTRGFFQKETRREGLPERHPSGRDPFSLHPVGQKLPNAWGSMTCTATCASGAQTGTTSTGGDYVNSPMDDPPGPATGWHPRVPRW